MKNRFGEKVAVVIPSYKVTAHVLDVISRIGPEVHYIYVVDDRCPEFSGDFVASRCRDTRVKVLRNEVNLGVGGAVITGYKAAIADGAAVIVKIDGDGQMSPEIIGDFIAPILSGEADYAKGNRFFRLDKISNMPLVRLFGNAVLSFMTKLSSGYWNLFDPTNGYTAIHVQVAIHLPFDKISQRYFFETDMLYHLNLLNAVVVDVPMDAKYGDEVSNLKIQKILGEFLLKHSFNLLRRIFYKYYLRNVSIASFELPVGIIAVIFGCAFGGYHWHKSSASDLPASSGTVMLAALPLLMGFQLILAFLNYDIASVPRRGVHSRHFK